MPLVSVGEFELSYSFNCADTRDDGLTLVLVHGAGGQKLDWPATWRSASKKMRMMGLAPRSEGRQLENYPIYAVDLPGHGKSTGQSQTRIEAYAGAIASFLEALDLKRVLLVGHSMGAAIALTLAVTPNQRLAGIALIGGSSRLVVTDAILQGLQNDFEPTVNNIVKYSWHRDTGAFFKQESRQRILDAGSDTVYRDFLACSQFDLSDRLAELEVPALIIASDHDRMVPLETSRKLAESLPQGTFVGLKNCGHYQHIEQARRVSDALGSFLQNELAG